jgi:hypothetical protein
LKKTIVYNVSNTVSEFLQAKLTPRERFKNIKISNRDHTSSIVLVPKDVSVAKQGLKMTVFN